MTANEKKICDIVFEKGELLSRETFVSEGIVIGYIQVEYLGELYIMTQHNGEWVYFHHC